jgi:predicted dehydrogenase
LNGASHVRLRVGVIGLGRLWETRHKPSLARLNDRFRVTAVYDQVARRAELEAAQLGCSASEGLTALIKRPDVDAVYLLSPQWFGLHPIRLACAEGKAVYCALPLAGDLNELEALAGLVDSGRIVFMPEFARRFYPATLRLKELLETRLGPPRLIVGQSWLFGFDRYAIPGPTTQIAPAPLSIDPGSYLLDWCRFLFQSSPQSVWGDRHAVMPGSSVERTSVEATEGSSDFESFAIGFEGGAAVRISYGRYHRGPWGEASRFLPPQGFQVFAERGAAWLEMPDRIQWSDSTGNHEERLPLEPTIGDVLNDRFYRLVQGDVDQAPTIHDALENARTVHDLRISQREGRVVVRDPN